MHCAFAYLLSRQMPSARDVAVAPVAGARRDVQLAPPPGGGGAESAPSPYLSFIAFSIIARASPLTAQAHWSTACTEPLVYLPRVPLLVAPRRGSCVHPPFIMRLSFHLIARASPPTAQANWLAACTEPRPKYFPLYRSLSRYRRLQQCLSVGVSGQGPCLATVASLCVHAGPSRFRPGGRAGASGNIFQVIVAASVRIRLRCFASGGCSPSLVLLLECARDRIGLALGRGHPEAGPLVQFSTRTPRASRRAKGHTRQAAVSRLVSRARTLAEGEQRCSTTGRGPSY
jgi:hypothetical protein